MKEASQSDPSTAIQAPASSSSQKWKVCEDEGDKYINEDVAAVASKIDSLEQRVAKAHSRRYTADILSTAIGKPNYLDVVRGETRGSMLEDSKTGLKWVNVTMSYFPSDLPGNIPHPCISEVNEVYESNSDRTKMAGSIQGPCEVLPPDKFQQENSKQRGLELEESARLQPIFLCSLLSVDAVLHSTHHDFPALGYSMVIN
ncbi:hypothetical protein K1719_016109 [Acacia pycnantha]|nr:hypothetical protein K1719_016109 [Acacia pycnantha]